MHMKIGEWFDNLPLPGIVKDIIFVIVVVGGISLPSTAAVFLLRRSMWITMSSPGLRLFFIAGMCTPWESPDTKAWSS